MTMNCDSTSAEIFDFPPRPTMRPEQAIGTCQKARWSQFIGLGITELSMHPSAIPVIKNIIRSSTSTEMKALAERALAAEGYDEPTPIQIHAIPPLLSGRDLLGCAQTGTGKTAAFALPILQRLAAAPPVRQRVIRALILSPTRELASQIEERFRAYGRHLSLRSTVIFGGVGQSPQVDRLRAGIDILVATPGRLLDLMSQGQVSLTNLSCFVLDEADRMLDMGFIHDVRKVIAALPKRRQSLFFSATMPPEVRELANSLLHDPVSIAVSPVSSVSSVSVSPVAVSSVSVWP